MTYLEWSAFLKDVNNWPNSFELNDWGRCQYNNAQLIYELYFKIKEDLQKEFGDRDLTIKVYLMSLFNIDYESAISVNEFQVIKRKLAKSYENDLNSINFERIGEIKDLTRNIHKAGRVEELFEIYRQRGYDLWVTAMTIVNHCFEGIDFNQVPIAPVTEEPESQKYNYMLGLICASLKDYGLVIDETCFEDFTV